MQAQARAQPNIALIKYWGKRDLEKNLPAVGSISVTLADLYSDMTVEIDASLGEDRLLVNGHESRSMLARVSSCVSNVAGSDRPAVKVSSEGNFPIAAGLASSASAFAALVVASDAAFKLGHSQEELVNLAGRASGSAARPSESNRAAALIPMPSSSLRRLAFSSRQIDQRSATSDR